MIDVMEIEIRGGPYDGASFWVQKNDQGIPTLGGAIGVYGGVPIHRDHTTGRLYVYWDDIKHDYDDDWHTYEPEPF